MGQNKVVRNIWQTLRGIIWLLIARYISNAKSLKNNMPKGAKNRIAVISLFFGAIVFKLLSRVFDKIAGYIQGMRKLTPLDEMFLTDKDYGQVCIMMRFPAFDF